MPSSPSGSGIEVHDARAGADVRQLRDRPGFRALEDQHHAEAAPLPHAAAHHVEVARLEDAQRQRAAGKQHGVEREQRQCSRPRRRQARPPQLGEQLVVQAAEAAVAHDEHVVAGRGGARQLARQRVDVGAGVAARAERAQHRAGIPAQVGGAYSHTSSAPASAGASVSRCTPMRMVCERGSSTAMMRAAADAAAQALERRRDRRRMVREVVVDADAARPRRAAPCAARRPAKLAQRRAARCGTSTPGVARGGDRRQRILHVVRADQRPLHRAARLRRPRAPRSASSRPRPGPAARVHSASALRRAREALERRPARPWRASRAEPRIGGVPDDAAAARHDAHQVMELALDGGHVRVDVGVVVLEVVEHHGARPVVHELGALVEERRVVLVRLDDEEGARAEARAQPEIGRHAADQEARRRGRRARGSRRAATRWWSCRACRPPPAPSGPCSTCARQPLRPGACRACRSRAAPRPPAGRAS